MTQGEKPERRRRLDPAVRRDLILDEAARVVMADGVSAVSMERLGRDAGISKALVYNYFASRNELLKALLLREYGRFQEEGQAVAAGVEDFAELVRVTTRAYLDHVARRGVLIQRLLNEPALASAIAGIDQQGRQLTVRYFAKAMTASFAIDTETATTVTDLLMGLTGAAGDYLYRVGGDTQRIEDLVVDMIMAAVRDAAARRAAPRTRAEPRVAML